MEKNIPVKSTNNSFGIFTAINSVMLLIVIGVYFGMIYGYLSKDWVEAKNCMSPVGEFSVEPSVDVSNVLISCPDAGYDTKGTCIYSSVPTLLQATRICNQQADKCSKFVYNSNSQKMKIVSLQGTPITGGQFDNTYTRQSNVTFKTSGTSLSDFVPEITPTVSVSSDGTVINTTSGTLTTTSI